MDVTEAVVTGAASGIGLALASHLHASGVRLVLADVDADALAATAADLDATAVPTDVADPDAVEALAASAPDAQLVCLNAGIVGPSLGAPWEVGAQEWDRVFAVNVGGVVNGLRVFVPRLLASGRPGHVAAALAAMHDGRFAVVPPEWAGAVTTRWDRLVAGERPVAPAITG